MINKKDLNKVAAHPLQTSYWSGFRKAWGNEVLETKYGILTIHHIPFTKHKVGMFIKGPKPTKTMLNDLKKIAKENNLVFIKLEPNTIVSTRHPELGSGSEKNKVPDLVRNDKGRLVALLKENGAVPGKTLFTPTTFQIDLTKSEEELMKSFSSKTRYNIRLAKKKGVEVVEDNSKKAFEKYLQLTRETVERQGFYAHSEKYHRLMWQHLHQSLITNHQSPIARLLVARHKREIVTAWIVFVWKDFLYYPYGASSSNPKHKNLMANNLMMWEAIRFGKKLGLKTFDLWGREPGKGFTKFKEGYNPKVVEFLGTWDLVINKPLYYLFRFTDILRWTVLRTKSKFSKSTF